MWPSFNVYSVLFHSECYSFGVFFFFFLRVLQVMSGKSVMYLDIICVVFLLYTFLCICFTDEKVCLKANDLAVVVLVFFRMLLF